VSFLSEDPLRRLAETALAALAGGASGDAVETDKIDCKEDPSRVQLKGRAVSQWPTRDDKAAEMLAEAAACMANSGGGVVIVGVEDKTGRLSGTDLEESWLRGRIYELADRRLTCTIESVFLVGTRLLIIIAPAAQELMRVRGKARHRVGRGCVEIDASEWVARHLVRLGYDWSAQSSGVAIDDVRPGALSVARRYLLSSGESRAEELAAAEEPDLLRRLGVVHRDGDLTNTGALMLTDRAERVLIDYRRREHPGGDSLLRLDRADVSLIEALQDVEQAISQANRLTHVPADSFAVGQIRAVPESAVRESLANAIAHRDWSHNDPVIVEFVGDTLIVQSPGGFAEGVDPDRLITAPAHTRNPHLADVLRRLRIAEREGIGVDRMFRELVRLGHPQPEIVELPGPHVRCALIGGQPDVRLLRLVTSLEPPQGFDDLDIVLLIDMLRKVPAVNATGLSQVLQKQPEEAAAALARAAGTLFRGQPLIIKTARTERYRHPDYRFGETAREHLGTQLRYHRHSREEVIDHVIAFVRRHGQIKNSDYVELFGVSAAYASTVLKELTSDEGGRILEPGRQPNRGRFAHYVAGPGFPGERES